MPTQEISLRAYYHLLGVRYGRSTQGQFTLTVPGTTTKQIFQKLKTRFTVKHTAAEENLDASILLFAKDKDVQVIPFHRIGHHIAALEVYLVLAQKPIMCESFLEHLYKDSPIESNSAFEQLLRKKVLPLVKYKFHTELIGNFLKAMMREHGKRISEALATGYPDDTNGAQKYLTRWGATAKAELVYIGQQLKKTIDAERDPNGSIKLGELTNIVDRVIVQMGEARFEHLVDSVLHQEEELATAQQDIRASEQDIQGNRLDIQDNRSDIRGIERTIANMALASPGLDRQRFLEQERNTPGNRHVVALVSGWQDSPSSSEDSTPPPPPTPPTPTSSSMPSLVASGSGLSNDEANNEDSGAQKKCPICLDLYSDEVSGKRAVTFLVPGGPALLEACGHLCCEECGNKLTTCWCCRGEVLGRNRIHL